MVSRIELTRGRHTLVDASDCEYLNQWRWSCSTKGYAVAWIYGKHVYMHRLIMNSPEGVFIDHINQDKLDNRKHNLRFATRRVNALNRGLMANNKSGHTGVFWENSTNKWRAQMRLGKKQYRLGYFDNKEDAILARKNFEEKVWSAL